MDASLLLFGASHHYKAPSRSDNVAEYREFNPGLGLKLDWDAPEGPTYWRPNVSAGAYRNSIGRTSIFAGPGIEIGRNYGVQASLIYITGYNSVYMNVAAAPGAFIRADRYSLHCMWFGNAVALYGEIEL